MSTATPPSETIRCQHCGVQTPELTAIKGQFCSTNCFDLAERRKTARDVLNQLETDHRFCGSCFAQYKTVEVPPRDSEVCIGPPQHAGRGKHNLLKKNCLIGFQYGTERTDEGERTRSVDEFGTERLADHGPICECGNTRHYNVEPQIRTRFAFDIAESTLPAALEQLRREDKTDAEVNQTALRGAIKKQLGGPCRPENHREYADWEIIIAAALDTES